MKMNKFTAARSKIILPALLLAVLFSLGFLAEGTDSDLFLKIYRGIDMYTRVYKEIAVNYVDTTDPSGLMRAGVDGMLKTLDPYTVFIGEKENDEIDLVTTGKYGGIGVTIGLRDGYITVINLLEGFSAAKRGIEIGDRILEIDGKNVIGTSLENVRQLVRGAPGTEIKISIEREGEGKPLTFVLIREEIIVRNIAYTGFVSDGIGYIKLERFSRTAGEDLKSAIKELRARQDLKGLVLDVRDNPGGLLESAVEVTSKFVPANSLVVSTRGRSENSERKYFSSEMPMLPDIPLVLLANRYSASASEIVCGAIQDLDRGVIVGGRTFGKGLVQTVTRLPDNSLLKMTTARYYTPSGRCIQEIDYWHRDSEGNGTTPPDSLRREYYTAAHRPVWGGHGISPDTAVTDTQRINFLDELNRKAMFFKYANLLASRKKSLPGDFDVTDDLIKDFEAFLKEKGFEYQEEGEEKIKDLKVLAANERYGKTFLEGLDRLDTILKKEKTDQVQRYKEEIRQALRTEILARIKGDKVRYEAAFKSDRQLQTAIGILNNPKVYKKLLK